MKTSLVWQNIMNLRETIDRVKIISRFKEFRRHRDRISEEDSLTILTFMFWLTSTGFEQYIRDYFHEVEHFDEAVVTWGPNDRGVDVKCKKGNQHLWIQCKKRIISPITEKEILIFIEQTQEIKKRLWSTLSLYFVTTNWINKYAWKRAKEWGIHMLYYKDMLNMDKKLDIYEFIKRHEKNPEIVTWIKVTKVLDTYYYRKIFWRVLWDFFNFIEKHVVGKIVDYYIDYEKVEEAYPENETNTALL